MQDEKGVRNDGGRRLVWNDDVVVVQAQQNKQGEAEEAKHPWVGQRETEGEEDADADEGKHDVALPAERWRLGGVRRFRHTVDKQVVRLRRFGMVHST